MRTALLFFLIHSAQAESVMSWQQCIQKTVSSNADLAAAVDAVKIAQGQFTGSYSNFLPQLSASASYTTSGSQGVVPTPGSLTQVVTIQNQYTESLSNFNQSVFNGVHRRWQRLSKRAQILRAAEAQLAVERATLSAALKTAYAQLLYQQEERGADRENILERRKNLRMIDLRFKGGSENKGSLLFQQGTVAQASVSA